MNSFSQALFCIARWIAGRARAEWVEAMAAEAASTDGNSTGWALGCLWASVKERAARNWSFVALILLLPAVVLWWKLEVFFTTSSLLNEQRITDRFAVTCWILSPFPLAFLFALVRGGRSTFVVVGAIFLIVEAFPLLMMWRMGVLPADWFGPKFNWYKCDPGVRIGLAGGVTLDSLAWVTAVWLGSAVRRRLNRTSG